MWDKMEIFYRVAKAGSFTKAEKLINKSQSALSRSVSHLEQRLGVRLLDRKHKGVELTRQGEQLFRISQNMFMQMDSFKKNLSEKKGMFGKIRIATTHAMASYILTDILIDFYEVYPDVKFEIQIPPPEVVV